MFQRIKPSVSDRIDSLVRRVEELEDREYVPKTVTCKECGCMVLWEESIASEPQVKTRKARPLYWNIDEEYIHRDYFCKQHAP